MRWSIIRLIWLRDLRDQLRDRRTVVMIALLPLVLYPVLGMAVMQFALGFATKPSRIGIVGKGPDFPPRQKTKAELLAVPAATWLALTPAGPGWRLDRLLGTAALAKAGSKLAVDSAYPLLVTGGKIPLEYFNLSEVPSEAGAITLPGLLEVQFLETDGRAQLEEKTVDLLLTAPDAFWFGVAYNRQPVLHIQTRDDDLSRQASNRLTALLNKWKKKLTAVRLRQHGLPDGFDDPLRIDNGRPTGGSGGQGLFDRLVKIFPFMLVMWALAGALYPAVDLCAGEKERGTMETLIISPASREEIVLGKFLTIWVFSAGTSLLNLVSMGLTAWKFGSEMPGEALRPLGLFWCVLLLIPLSAFFSALCLSVGAYARSSKEGQYYLMPLFLVTMPLVFLTLAPGVELSPFYSLVPVTGVALLMQRLMSAAALEPGTWLYFLPVLAPIVLYSWLALRWAIAQFKREEVLFREAERLEIGLWLRHIFRDKEALPSTGQAVFCFAVIMVLRWLSLGLGKQLPLLVHAAIVLLAFVGTPAVFMALLLTTRPRQGLGLITPPRRTMLTALFLAAVVLVPLVQLTLQIYQHLSIIKEMVEEHQALVRVLRDMNRGATSPWWTVLSIVVLPALCEELAFRGFILSGLRRRLQPWNAIWLSSFMFALYHMNVFQFLPTFILGAILALLTIRSGSIWPAIVFHLLHNGFLVGSTWLPHLTGEVEISAQAILFLRLTVTGLCTLLAGFVLWRLISGTPLPGPNLKQEPEVTPTSMDTEKHS